VRRLALVVAVVTLLGGLFLFGLLRGRPDRNIPSAFLERQVPDFTLPLYERYQAEFGPELARADLGVRPQVINFWASWCAPCYDEAPELAAAWRAHGDEVLFIGVQTQDPNKRTEGRQFLEQFDLGFPNGIDDDSAIAVSFGLFGVPETFFVRADGTLAYRHTGPVTVEVLEAQLAALTE
jgi:cytochrome c biogenesis protein CcmG/thiol:disulfide interchange protein DsbE